MPKNSKENPLKKYLALTGIAFEMGAIIFVCAYLGGKLDTYFNTSKEWYTTAFVLFGVVASIYLIIKRLNRINKNE